MDGKPLYEYARTGTPLPRPIPARKVTVHSLRLLRFDEGDQHAYEMPKEGLEEDKKKELARLEKMVKEGRTTVPTEEEVVEAPKQDGGESSEAVPAPADDGMLRRWSQLDFPDGRANGHSSAAASTAEASTPAAAFSSTSEPSAARPPIFEIELTVSSGTYIRSIVHDIGLALGSAAHVVKLTRTRQGEFVLDPPSATTVLQVDTEGEANSEEKVEAEKADKQADNEKTNEEVAGGAAEDKLELETFSGGCVEWSLLEKAIAEHAAAKKEGKEVTEGRDADGWLEWERDLLAKCKEV